MISAVVTALLQTKQATSKHRYQADRIQKRRVSWGACHARFLGTLLRTPTGRPGCRKAAVGSLDFRRKALRRSL